MLYFPACKFARLTAPFSFAGSKNTSGVMLYLANSRNWAATSAAYWTAVLVVVGVGTKNDICAVTAPAQTASYSASFLSCGERESASPACFGWPVVQLAGVDDVVVLVIDSDSA